MVFSAEVFDAEAVAVVVAGDECAVVGSVVDEQPESNKVTHAARPAMRMECAWVAIIIGHTRLRLGLRVADPSLFPPARSAIGVIASHRGGRVRLEAVRIGGAWKTSEESVQRFAEALTGDDAPPPAVRAPTARRQASLRAEAALIKAGC